MQDALKQLLWGCSQSLPKVVGASSGVIGCALDAPDGLSETSWALLKLVGASWQPLGRLPGKLQDLFGAFVGTCRCF